MAEKPRLREKYETQVKEKLMKRFGYKNVMQIPKLEKIVVNVGLGEAVQNQKVVEYVSEQLAAITGQKPLVTRAKRAIAGFKLRKGMPIGCKVTLRGARMWEFLDRFITLAAPRIRDFRGFSRKAFDGRGNYNVGITEQIIFPEINYDEIDKIRGMQITFVSTAKTDKEMEALLEELGFPFEYKQGGAK